MTGISDSIRYSEINSEDVYVVVEQYSHRVVLKHEPSGRIFKVTVGHLNPEGFGEYQPV